MPIDLSAILSNEDLSTFQGVAGADPLLQAAGQQGYGYGSMPFYNPSPIQLPQAPTGGLSGGISKSSSPVIQSPAPVAINPVLAGGVTTNVNLPSYVLPGTTNVLPGIPPPAPATWPSTPANPSFAQTPAMNNSTAVPQGGPMNLPTAANAPQVSGLSPFAAMYANGGAQQGQAMPANIGGGNEAPMPFNAPVTPMQAALHAAMQGQQTPGMPIVAQAPGANAGGLMGASGGISQTPSFDPSAAGGGAPDQPNQPEAPAMPPSFDPLGIGNPDALGLPTGAADIIKQLNGTIKQIDEYVTVKYGQERLRIRKQLGEDTKALRAIAEHALAQATEKIPTAYELQSPEDLDLRAARMTDSEQEMARDQAAARLSSAQKEVLYGHGFVHGVKDWWNPAIREKYRNFMVNQPAINEKTNRENAKDLFERGEKVRTGAMNDQKEAGTVYGKLVTNERIEQNQLDLREKQERAGRTKDALQAGLKMLGAVQANASLQQRARHQGVMERIGQQLADESSRHHQASESIGFYNAQTAAFNAETRADFDNFMANHLATMDQQMGPLRQAQANYYQSTGQPSQNTLTQPPPAVPVSPAEMGAIDALSHHAGPTAQAAMSQLDYAKQLHAAGLSQEQAKAMMDSARKNGWVK